MDQRIYQTQKSNSQTQRSYSQIQRSNCQIQRSNSQTQRSNCQTQRSNSQTQRSNCQTQRSYSQIQRSNSQPQRSNSPTQRSYSQTSRFLMKIVIAVLLCLGYFNYFVIAEPVSVVFQISALIGQLLVNLLLTICSSIFRTLKLTFSFFEILLEDSVIFLIDAVEKFLFVFYLIKAVYLFLEKVGCNVLNGVYGVVEFFFRILCFLVFTVWNFKQGIQLIGSTIWHLFTSLPGAVILSVKLVFELFTNACIEILCYVFRFIGKIIEALGKIYHLLFLPFDSICGLIIGAVLLTILYVKFRYICYLTSTAIFKLYECTVSSAIFLWSGRFLEHGTKYNDEDDERLCVICQNQQRNIILFPCKHLCLCEVCIKELTKIQQLCPLCRSQISGTLRVYT